MAFQGSPVLKFENSPAESFISTPGENYPSLFAVTTPSATNNTMNPMEMMTPKSFAEEKSTTLTSTTTNTTSSGTLTGLATIPESPTSSSTTEKKPAKKRKSWGQVLPEPKTNLPPRKRAKTEDEKEQRRVERVLRNRRAAQSSRERKRLEVEALERRNKELEQQLLSAQKANLMLVEELNRFRRNSGVVTRSSSPLDSLRDNPALSQQLFSSQDGHNPTVDTSNTLMDDLMMSSNNTVNPASLSPELGPVSASSDSLPAPEQPSKDAQSSESDLATSPDMTQRPAEMLCDLQCQTSAELPKSFRDSQISTPPTLALALQLRMMLLSASAILLACQRPLTQIAMSWKAGFSLLPTPQLLTTIIWLVTLPPSTSSTSTSSSMTTQTIPLQNLWQRATMSSQQTKASTSTRPSTLRLKSLRKLLSSSPSLARPLLDATLVALRLVSEGRENRVEDLRSESDGTRGNDCELTRCLRGIDLPSMEVLMTLSWALKVYEQRRMEHERRRSNTVLDSENSAQNDNQPINSTISREVGEKRKLADIGSTISRKRGRLS